MDREIENRLIIIDSLTKNHIMEKLIRGNFVVGQEIRVIYSGCEDASDIKYIITKIYHEYNCRCQLTINHEIFYTFLEVKKETANEQSNSIK